MKRITINEKEYELVKDNGNCFNLEDLKEKITDFFDDYDFIFCDYAYDKIRLKGFYSSSNKKVSKVNNIDGLDEYIRDYCAYGAKYFLIKKIN